MAQPHFDPFSAHLCINRRPLQTSEGKDLKVVPPNLRTNILEKITKVVTNVLTHYIFASHANILTECVTKQEKNVRTK